MLLGLNITEDAYVILYSVVFEMLVLASFLKFIIIIFWFCISFSFRTHIKAGKMKDVGQFAVAIEFVLVFLL